MEDLPFLDTNIVLLHLLNDHLDHSPRATAFMHPVERGEIRVRTADTVVFETVFVFERSFRFPKIEVRAAIQSGFELDGVELPDKDRFRRAMAQYVELNIPFADAYHSALMVDVGSPSVVSFDRHFDRITALPRVEP